MSTFFPQNKFQNDMYTRQKFNVKFQNEACLDYFSRNEDKQGFIKFYLDIRLLYYIVTDKVCNTITWRKSQGIVVIEQEDELMPEWTFTIDSWKGILSKYCVYLDEQKKHIYGRRDILQKMVALFEAYRNGLENRFSKRFSLLIGDKI